MPRLFWHAKPEVQGSACLKFLGLQFPANSSSKSRLGICVPFGIALLVGRALASDQQPTLPELPLRSAADCHGPIVGRQ